MTGACLSSNKERMVLYENRRESREHGETDERSKHDNRIKIVMTERRKCLTREIRLK